MESKISDSIPGSLEIDFTEIQAALQKGHREKVRRILSLKIRSLECHGIPKIVPHTARIRTTRHKRIQHRRLIESRRFVKTCITSSPIHRIVEMLLSETSDGNSAENQDQAHRTQQTLQIKLAREPNIVRATWRGLTLLHVASFRGRSDLVTMLLTHGADANSIVNKASWEAELQNSTDQNDALLSLNHKIKDEYLTPVMMAATEGHFEIVAMLVKHGAHTEETGLHSALHFKTPLFYAVENSRFELVQLLINCGARVDARDQLEQRTLLHMVQDADMARQLINFGGLDVNARDKKLVTPMHCAAGRHDIKVAEVLLANGADINAEDIYGETPLYHALNGRCTLELIQFLINSGSDIKHRTNIEKRTPLHESIISANCNYEVIKLILESGSDVNAVDSENRTSLHLAIEIMENFSHDVVKLLLSNGADVNATDQFGQIPLHLACKKGDRDTVKLLLDSGSDINRSTKLGMLPLHYSLRYGNTEIVQNLLQRGSNVNRFALDFSESVNVRSQLTSALFIAISQKNYNIVKTLIKHGADVNLRDEYGTSALHNAAENNWTAGIKLLLENGAEPNLIGGFHKGTAVHIVVKRNLLDALKMLVEYGADVNAIDQSGSTALHYAAKIGSVETVKFLLENGANVKAFTDSTWSTPLHVAAIVNSPSALRLLIEHGADLDAADGRNKTAIDLAAQFGLEENTRLLLKSKYKKVDESHTKWPSSFSLHFAARHSSSNILKMLIRQGYSVNAADESGKTPLHYAAEFGCEANLRILLAHGGDVNGVTMCSHSTPLHLSARRNCLKALRLLIDNGANVMAIDGDGNTPLHCAVDTGSLVCARVLISCGGDNNKRNNYGLTPLDLAVARDRRSMEVEIMMRDARKKNVFPLTLQWVTTALTCCKKQ